MSRTLSLLGITVPEGPDPNNVPQDLGYVADYLNANPGVSRLTATQIAALTGPQKPAGRVVYNTTVGKLQVSDGSTFSDVTATGLTLSGVAPAAIVPDSAGAAGSSTSAARADHVHALAADTAVTIEAGGTNTEGTSTAVARADHTHELQVGAPEAIVPRTTAVQGSSPAVARADHKHAIATAAGSTIQPDDTAGEGTATSFSRSDHKHAIATDVPVALGATAAEGTSTAFSRADHVHPYPTAAQVGAASTATVTDLELFHLMGAM